MQERLIASYGRRRGRRLRGIRRELIDEALPELQLTPEIIADYAAAHAGKLWLEIGFGGGEHLAAQAAAHKEIAFIGCEPYIDGVGSLLKLLTREGCDNVRIFNDDARLLIDQLPDACLARVFILFPDPWPKARHHKRRLIQRPFLQALARAMPPGATLLLATDHADYLASMLEQLLASVEFTWTARRCADWTHAPPGWVRTRYQEKAEREGRIATYLEFLRK
ncbi:MAG: tRNA (guanosine(46)-N7)-methyltransferase TrmB [Alphaproteobacteria bacterium]|nr:tRNA (guanosine(46)-N7)-methyltransferase TrmB [Alphaproteobacteria bacterium]